MGQNGGGVAHPRQDSKIFCGGLSWGTTADKLEAYFSNFGQVLEAFVSYDRHTGRPRGFGFVVFDDPQVAEKVASLNHTIDRREVEAKKAVPKEEHPGRAPGGSGLPPGRTRKVFVGGLAPSVDEAALRQYFEQFGAVDDAVVMYDHESRRPRGFGFVTFTNEETVDDVLNAGPLQALHDKQIEIKKAVPRDQMPAPRAVPLGGRGGAPPYLAYGRGAAYGAYGPPAYPQPPAYGLQAQGFGQAAYGGPGYRGGVGMGAAGLGGQLGGMPGGMSSAHLGIGATLAGLSAAGFPGQYGGGHSIHGDPGQLVAGMGGGFGQNPYNVGVSGGVNLGGGGGGNMNLGGGSLGGGGGLGGGGVSPGALADGGLVAGSLGSASGFNMGSLQNALPAVQTGGSATDSFAAATGGGGSAYNSAVPTPHETPHAYNSAVPTPHETPHKPYGTPHAIPPQSPSGPAPGGYIASSPSAFDSALGSPIGSSLAAAHLTPRSSHPVTPGSLGRDTPGHLSALQSSLQSSFTDTPLGSASWT